MKLKPEHYYIQSAVIPFRLKDDKIEVLLITSKNGNWIVPKGIIEPGLPSYISAAKEALEEAGVKGTVHEVPIGSYKYKKWGDTCAVEVFAMRVEKIYDEWDEQKFRDREWFSLKKVSKLIKNEDLSYLVNSIQYHIGKF